MTQLSQVPSSSEKCERQGLDSGQSDPPTQPVAPQHKTSLPYVWSVGTIQGKRVVPRQTAEYITEERQEKGDLGERSGQGAWHQEGGVSGDFFCVSLGTPLTLSVLLDEG